LLRSSLYRMNKRKRIRFRLRMNQIKERNEKKSQFKIILSYEMRPSRDLPRPAVRWIRPVGVQEGDPAAPPVAGDNPRVVHTGHG
jgi:hypothetical protein